MTTPKNEKIDWVGCVPFFLIHAACLLVFFVGFSWIALAVAFFLYLFRGMGITGGFHRYFSHRSYKTSRIFQFVIAWVGTSALQKGPLWWAAHHRHHHKHSDQEHDIHSPGLKGLFFSHIGWILCTKYNPTNEKLVRDWLKYPELVWINKFFWVPPLILAVLLYLGGHLAGVYYPQLNTNGPQMLIWGFFISTMTLSHATYCINSLTHLIGRRRFKTTDDSRNSFILAIPTFGEGWHNNHHNYPKAESQGYYWWEFDITHYFLTMLSWVGLVWGIHRAPASIYEKAREARKATKAEAKAKPLGPRHHHSGRA